MKFMFKVIAAKTISLTTLSVLAYYSLHAARILAALPEEKPHVRHIVSVWRAKN